jgi:hypothetical protein
MSQQDRFSNCGGEGGSGTLCGTIPGSAQLLLHRVAAVVRHDPNQNSQLCFWFDDLGAAAQVQLQSQSAEKEMDYSVNIDSAIGYFVLGSLECHLPP